MRLAQINHAEVIAQICRRYWGSVTLSVQHRGNAPVQKANGGCKENILRIRINCL